MSDDPLLSALISKLPASGQAFAKADRINWLRMFVMASNLAYGDAPGICVTDVEEKPRLQFSPVLVEELAAGVGPLQRSEPSAPRFSVDSDGFAMRDGMPIDPEDVPPGAVIHDERRGAERGDLACIYWKNGGARKLGQLPNHLKLQEAA